MIKSQTYLSKSLSSKQALARATANACRAVSRHCRMWGAGSVTLGNPRKPYLADSSVANFCLVVWIFHTPEDHRAMLVITEFCLQTTQFWQASLEGSGATVFPETETLQHESNKFISQCPLLDYRLVSPDHSDTKGLHRFTGDFIPVCWPTINQEF